MGSALYHSPNSAQNFLSCWASGKALWTVWDGRYGVFRGWVIILSLRLHRSVAAFTALGHNAYIFWVFRWCLVDSINISDGAEFYVALAKSDMAADHNDVRLT